MPITLTVTEGPHQGQSFTFTQHDNFIVGRSVRAHFRLAAKDKYFSRFHFMVEVNPPRCRLLDLGSHNGTFVNGTRVGSHELQHGDSIKAGRTVLHVVMEAELEDAPESIAPPPVLTAKEDRAPLAAPLPPQSPSIPELVIETVAHTPDRPAAGEREVPPPTVPGFRVIRLVGKGAMGVVHLAVREADGIEVALKTVRPSVAGTPSQLARFLREARILQHLDHPHIVAFRQMGEVNGLLYFAMDYVPGTDAKHLLEEHGPLPVTAAVRLVCQALKGVIHAHEHGIVHRDLKPANLLITTADGKRFVKVADFGLARVYQASQLSGLTLTGDIGGTPAFMAPEQVTDYRDANPTADQYAMAATLYNLLTDRYPFDATTAQEFFRLVLEEEPVPLCRRRPDVPEGLAAVIHRGLEKEPAKRFLDAAAFRAAIKPFGS